MSERAKLLALPSSDPQRSSPNLLGAPLRDEIKRIVIEALQEVGESPSYGEEKWFFSSEEASRLIGIPKTWLESAAKRGEIKRIQFGHYKVFSREELQRFAEDYKKKSSI